MSSVTPADEAFEAIERSLKKVVAAFERAGIPFLLGGGIAAWARGGPESYKDLDFMVRPEDSERALDALAQAGLQTERPPEQWLVKAWDGDVLIDVIYHPEGVEITDEVLERADEMSVFGVHLRVMALEDILVSKLLALGEHDVDYESLLQISRSLREQVDWGAVRARTSHYPYARAFFTLAEGLGIATPAGGEAAPRGHPVRVRAA